MPNHQLTRREFIKSSTLAATGTALAPYVASAATRQQKPNLLFLWTDEQRADTMACYGNRKIQAPNLNKLALESTVFERAYVSQPVCTPSRSTVMTGLWPHQSGCTQNNVALKTETKTLPELMDDSAYRTGYFGKWHLGDELFAQQGFEEWRSIEDMYWKYFHKSRDLRTRSSYHHYLEDLGYTPNNTERNEFSRDFAARLPIEHCKPKYLEQETCDFLSRHRDDPFMLYVNFLEPHMPFFGPLDELHAPDEIDLPANFLDILEKNEPEIYRQQREKYLESGYHEYDLKQEADWRKLIAKYWGLVSQVDRGVGAILTHLERLGLAENTIVVYTSDHGDMMGSHKMLTKGVMYEEAARVPWLMRVPELGQKKNLLSKPASHIDLVPTLLDLMGCEARDALPGQSLRPTMEGGAVEEDHVFLQWSPNRALQSGRNPGGRLHTPDAKTGNSTRTVVSPEGWKLCLNDQDRNQLFNLKADPGECTNRSGESACKEVEQRLRKQIVAWQERVADPLPRFA